MGTQKKEEEEKEINEQTPRMQSSIEYLSFYLSLIL